MSNKIKLGKECETLVCRYLQNQGVEILERNYRLREGEIDIICADCGTLCAVEVKKIPETWEEQEIQYKISNFKKLKIKKTLSYYLVNDSECKYDEIRFDVAAVKGNEIIYWKGAF